MGDAEVGSLVVKMKADLSDYLQKLDQMDSKTSASTGKTEKAFASITSGLTKATAALGTFAAISINSAMKWGNAVDDLSDKTGMAGEEASKLLVIAKRVGIGAEEAGMMFARFARSAYDAAQAQVDAAASGKQATDAYSKLGVAVTNNDGTMKNASQLFSEVKDKIAEMPDGLAKTATEMALFGRSGAAMHDMLNMSAEEIQKVTDKAQQMGLILSTEQAAAWEKFERDVNSAKGTLTSLGVAIGNEVMPQLQSMIGSIQNSVSWFTALDPETRQNTLSIIKLGAEIGIVCLTITKVTGAIGAAAEALGIMKIATWAAAGPWVALAAAIGLALKALYDYNMEAVSKVAEVQYDERTGETNYIQKSSAGGMGDFRQATDRASDKEIAKLNAQRAMEEMRGTVINPSAGAGDTGSSSAGDTKTELQQYIEMSSKLTQLWQSEVDLNEISREGYKKLLTERLDGLRQIQAGEDELMDQKQAEKSLEVQIQSLEQKIREENMTDAISAQKRILSAKKDTLSQSEEAERHNLQMSETFSQDDYDTKRANWSKEADLQKQTLDDTYAAESANINATIQMYEELRTKKGTLTREENEQYQNYLEQKRSLDAKYALDREKVENSYVEKVASQQRQIIDANNNMISSLILNTKSGHDILSDMWTDFVKQTVAKLWSINSETNIFTMLLGGLFGGSGGNSGGLSNGYGYNINTGVTDYSNFEFRASGGPVTAGKNYIVGENGPELFMPSYNGSIIPNSAITSGGALQSNGTVSNMSFNVNQTFNGQQEAGVVAQIKASIPYIKSEIRDAIRNETAMRNAVKGAST